jgi:hypothetical protein
MSNPLQMLIRVSIFSQIVKVPVLTCQTLTIGKGSQVHQSTKGSLPAVVSSTSALKLHHFASFRTSLTTSQASAQT